MFLPLFPSRFTLKITRLDRPQDHLDAVLITYKVVQEQKAILLQLPVGCLVVDEAHQSKNEQILVRWPAYEAIARPLVALYSERENMDKRRAAFLSPSNHDLYYWQLSKVLREFSAKFRLVLTRTPVKNDPHELLALLNILFPTFSTNSESLDALSDAKSGRFEKEDLDLLYTVRKAHSVACPHLPWSTLIRIFLLALFVELRDPQRWHPL